MLMLMVMIPVRREEIERRVILAEVRPSKESVKTVVAEHIAIRAAPRPQGTKSIINAPHLI